MDVIAFIGGFLAGLLLPSLLRAVGVAVGLELTVTGYQYFLAQPRAWGDDLPAELVGLGILVVIAAGCAGLGQLVRRWRLRSRGEAVA
jgi:hypothetical protein